MTQSTFIPNSYQTPNAYVDIFLAYLTSNEWKVLSYMARRIFGFQKRQDSISLSQFSGGIINSDGEQIDYGTGLSRPTILKCIKSLEDAGLIKRVAENNPKINAGTVFALQLDSGMVDFMSLKTRKNEQHINNKRKTDNAKAAGDLVNAIDRGKRHLPGVVNAIDRTQSTPLTHNNQLITSLKTVNIKASQNFENFKLILDTFTDASKIKPPRESSLEYEREWDGAIMDMLQAADGDAALVCKNVTAAIARLDKSKYTINSPKSILKTVKSLIGGNKRGAPADDHHYREVYE